MWLISLCTIFVVGFNNFHILLLFETYHWSFFVLWLVIFDLLFYATYILAWDYWIVCEVKIIYCLPYLSDLSSEVTICCQVAIPGTDGNEHCTSVDGCLKWCGCLVQYIHILGISVGEITVCLLLLPDTSIRLTFPIEGFHYYHIYLNTVQCHFGLFEIPLLNIHFHWSKDKNVSVKLPNLIYFCV